MLCGQHEADGDWPDTYIVQTPTDSFHHYFINPGGRYGNSPGGLPEGIDVRGGGRDSGGYVLAAGSVLDRRAYEGNPEMQAIVGDRKAYRVYNDAKIMEPPGWLIALLDAPRPARKGRRGGGEIGDGRNVVHRPVWAVKVEPAGQLNARIKGALRLLSDEGPGSENRNNLCYWASKIIGQVVAAGRMDQADAEADLMAAMEANKFIRDHDEYAARATIRSGFKWAGV